MVGSEASGRRVGLLCLAPGADKTADARRLPDLALRHPPPGELLLHFLEPIRKWLPFERGVQGLGRLEEHASEGEGDKQLPVFPQGRKGLQHLYFFGDQRSTVGQLNLTESRTHKGGGHVSRRPPGED